ncbi:hypothetical protein PR048_030646 [Dryococelus australis]|uniref:Uncharacterized protein n=1 Tax=Dryococelus australis TaxID=614101 RepID=A0ABQ9G9I5_9NEOP|nr:hypothetical protein PR048_030646 [Dryococelus australis]
MENPPMTSIERSRACRLSFCFLSPLTDGVTSGKSHTWMGRLPYDACIHSAFSTTKWRDGRKKQSFDTVISAYRDRRPWFEPTHQQVSRICVEVSCKGVGSERLALPHSSGVGLPTYSRGVVGSHHGPSAVACRTGILSANYSPTTCANRVPGGVARGFSHVEIVPDDASGRRFFSGISLPLWRCSILTSLHLHRLPRPPIELEAATRTGTLTKHRTSAVIQLTACNRCFPPSKKYKICTVSWDSDNEQFVVSDKMITMVYCKAIHDQNCTHQISVPNDANVFLVAYQNLWTSPLAPECEWITHCHRTLVVTKQQQSRCKYCTNVNYYWMQHLEPCINMCLEGFRNDLNILGGRSYCSTRTTAADVGAMLPGHTRSRRCGVRPTSSHPSPQADPLTAPSPERPGND